MASSLRSNDAGLTAVDSEEDSDGAPTVVIVDDHTLFAEAVEASLIRGGFDVVAVASNGDRARAAVNVHHPDLVVLDLHMPGCDGVDLGADLLSRHPEVKLILVTGFPDAESMKRALSVGFHGFLSKDASMGEFITALRAVLEGNVVLPMRFAPRMAGARSNEEQTAAILARQLTDREWEILEFLVAGLSSGQIAQSMSISVNTVRTHVQNVLAKLQVRSRLEAVAFAMRHHLLDVAKEA